MSTLTIGKHFLKVNITFHMLHIARPAVCLDSHDFLKLHYSVLCVSESSVVTRSGQPPAVGLSAIHGMHTTLMSFAKKWEVS